MKKKTNKWVACPVEAEYFKDDRKQARLERKIASSRDRSKFKKSDREQVKKNDRPEDDALLRGRILSIASEGIIVEHQGERYLSSLRGALKQEKTDQKNLVVVGDFVLFTPTTPTEGVIAYVEERHSILSRADNLHRRKEQLIAANIDQVLITVSIKTPPLKPFLVDRYIIAAKKGGMEPIIVVNKYDLLHEDPEEQQLYQQFLAAYNKAGVAVLSVSVKDSQGMDELQAAMKDKVSVFSGQSGVGKSSLINALTGSALTVRCLVEKTNKGSHTTTTAQLLPLPFGGWVIDTPGIKSFGVWQLDEEELDSYFSEISLIGEACPFNDCSHTHEQGCAVQQAVMRGEIPSMRYESYLYLLASIREEHRSR